MSEPEFQWIPGQGPDLVALRRLREHFPKPSTPMGEAWFMGSERRIFTELVEHAPTEIPVSALHQALVEVAGGTTAFGAFDEWTDWYHYLLANTIPRAYETHALDYLVENLITAFMALYPAGVTAPPYSQFRTDVLTTLGRANMQAELWNGDEIVIGRCLRARPGRNGLWRWWDASGDFSAQMFFCLKYLATEQISAWVRSVFAIRSPHWRAQLLVWLLGAKPFLASETRHPEKSPKGRPTVYWSWSHVLYHEDPQLVDAAGAPFPRNNENPFLSDERKAEFMNAVGLLVSDDALLEWLDGFSRYDYLERELLGLPERFQDEFLDQ